jgi:catechol 2,3-dioxygenase-like lactoylglutathione lyase family enzyme
MRGFYTELLGFPVHREIDGWVELRAGATLLTLRPRGRTYDGPAPAVASVQLAFRVAPAEVDACHEALRAAGIEILEPPQEHYGHRTVFFRDPDANVLEIYADV